MKEIIEKLKRLQANLPVANNDLNQAIASLEMMTKPGALICWVEGIQGHGTCELTTGYCGFWSGKDADDHIKKLRVEKPDMNYVKIFPIYVKEVK